MTDRLGPVQTLQPGTRHGPVDERSRDHHAARDTYRSSFSRRPDVELQTNHSDNRPPGRMFESSRRGHNHAIMYAGTNGRSMEHETRDSEREDNFREIPRSGRSRTSNMDYDDFVDDDDGRYVVPALPMPVAIICCILNFIIPGFGSMTASVCLLCCGKTDDMTGKEKCGSCLTVFGIGLLQLVLVACFLIGWIWSCIWGVTFIGMSATFYDEEDEAEAEAAERPETLTNGGIQGRGRLPTPQIVEDQPYPGLRYEDLRRERSRRRREQRSRRTRSRISITPSTLIYPMRAPSNIAYSSPPPTYQESETERMRNRHEMSRSRPTAIRNTNHQSIPEDLPVIR